MALISGTSNLYQLISFTGATTLDDLKEGIFVSWFQRVSVHYGKDAIETQAHGPFVGPQAHGGGCSYGRRPGSRQHGRIQADHCFPGLSLAMCFFQLVSTSQRFHRLQTYYHQLRNEHSRPECVKYVLDPNHNTRSSLSWLPPSTPASPASPILAQGDKVDWNVFSIFWVRHFKAPMVLGNPLH